jgi:transcriptional regulator with XRE-family HTH domain
MLRILDPQEIGRRIREVRIAAGFSQAELAVALGAKSANFVSRLEQGATKTVNYDKLIKIANLTASRWMLEHAEPEDVLAYLEGRVDALSVTIGGKQGDIEVS